MKIFSVKQSAERDKVVIGDPAEFVADDSATVFAAVRVKDSDYVLQYQTKSGKITLTSIPDGATHDLQIESGATLINNFTLGDMIFLLSYTKTSGAFQVRRLHDDLSVGEALPFRRTHEPGITAGFTTVGVFDQGNRAAFMGYDHESGRVAIFNVEMTARGQGGGPPIAIHNSWSHQWATGWTRFAFFPLGDETFFLKTNDIWHNVNIDHINRNPELGTNEVATRMNLIDAYEISLVAPMMLGHGDPYFIAYKPDGQTVIYRIHGDCAGWTRVAAFDAPRDARGLIAFGSGTDGHIVLT